MWRLSRWFSSVTKCWGLSAAAKDSRTRVRQVMKRDRATLLPVGVRYEIHQSRRTETPSRLRFIRRIITQAQSIHRTRQTSSGCPASLCIYCAHTHAHARTHHTPYMYTHSLSPSLFPPGCTLALIPVTGHSHTVPVAVAATRSRRPALKTALRFRTARMRS